MSSFREFFRSNVFLLSTTGSRSTHPATPVFFWFLFSTIVFTFQPALWTSHATRKKAHQLLFFFFLFWNPPGFEPRPSYTGSIRGWLVYVQLAATNCLCGYDDERVGLHIPYQAHCSLIARGSDPFFPRCSHLVVQKYDQPSAGAAGGREREARTIQCNPLHSSCRLHGEEFAAASCAYASFAVQPSLFVLSLVTSGDTPPYSQLLQHAICVKV